RARHGIRRRRPDLRDLPLGAAARQDRDPLDHLHAHLDLGLLARGDLRRERTAAARDPAHRGAGARALRVDRPQDRQPHPRGPLPGAASPRDRRRVCGEWVESGHPRRATMNTPATALLAKHGVPYPEHEFEYREHGGTSHSSSSMGVPGHNVIKTLVMEDEKGDPLIVLMHGDRKVSTKELARQANTK